LEIGNWKLEFGDLEIGNLEFGDWDYGFVAAALPHPLR
jgi:hypothetical protein